MTIMTLLEFAGMDRQAYDRLGASLQAQGAPAGILFHSCGAVPNGWRIVDAWRSQEDFDHFVDETLLPAARSLASPRRPGASTFMPTMRAWWPQGLLSANARHPHVAVPHGMTKEVSFLEQLARPTINCSRNFKFLVDAIDRVTGLLNKLVRQRRLHGQGLHSGERLPYLRPHPGSPPRILDSSKGGLPLRCTHLSVDNMKTNNQKTSRKQSSRNGILSGITCLMLFNAAGPATASSGGTQGGISVHYGVGDRYQRYTLNYETPSVWTTRFGGRWGRLDLTPEIGVSYWTADRPRSPGQAWQFSAIPMFRWWTSERFYIEAGVGATVLTRTRFSNRNIGSAFQFGDHIGVGFLLTPNSRVGVRYSHFSNAGIKRPNPGLDTVQLTYTHQF